MRKEKGITLVALIITIIIMLILVAVSVNILVKSNLIGTAEKAANGYKTAYERENDGSITINGEEYSSIDEYIKNINSNIEMNYKIDNGFIVVTASYKGEEPTDEDYEKYIRQQLEGKELPEKQQMLLDSVNFKAEMNGQPTFKDLDDLFAKSSWEDFVKQVGNDNADQALINYGICPQYWYLIITLPDGTKKISSEPPLAPFEVRYAIKQTGKYEFKAEIFGEENSRSIIIRDENEITIVEGNAEDWGYTEEDDGTITITEYKNTDTTIDTVIIPNCIDGKPVKTVKGERNYPERTNQYRSIWNDALLAENSEWIGEYNSRNFKTYKNTTIKKVVISKGIETIETGAFSGSTSLTQIELPETLKNIGEASFAACVSLQEITIPNNVTRVDWWIFIGKDMNITVNVPWKENEKPEGWNEDWNYAFSAVVTTVYAK